MSSSLYYFLPRAPHQAGRYVANSVLFLGTAGLVCFGVLVAMPRPSLRSWLSNSELSAYVPWIGAYLFLMMLSSALEIVLISRGQYFWASASLCRLGSGPGGGPSRAGAGVPRSGVAAEGRRPGGVSPRASHALLLPAVSSAAAFTPDRVLFKSQLAYALPFAAAVLVEIAASEPSAVRGVVSVRSGHFCHLRGRLPANPTGRFRGVADQRRDDGQNAGEAGRRAKAGRARNLARHDMETGCTVLSPGRVLVVAAPRDHRPPVYHQVPASVPIFMVWSAMILLSTFQVDGVMRVFAQTRFLLVLNLMRLAIIAG